jgi:DNA-binding NarL/FixJ family response regulator
MGKMIQEKLVKSKPNRTPKIRVGLFDDDPLRLIGFRALLGAERDLELKITGSLDLFDAAGIDVAVLRGRPGYNLAAQVRKLIDTVPGTRVLTTGSDLSERDIIDAIGLGVKGHVNETASAAEFASAIRAVNQGLIWAPRRIVASVIDRMIESSPSARFGHRMAITEREKQVLRMLVAGSSNKEIAAPLGIEERTVKSHISHLMRKLGVKNRIEVSVQAIRQSIVSV